MPKKSTIKGVSNLNLVGAALKMATALHKSFESLMFASDGKSFQDEVVCPLGGAYSIMNNARKAEQEGKDGLQMSYDTIMTEQDKAQVLALLQKTVEIVQGWETIDGTLTETEETEEELVGA